MPKRLENQHSEYVTSAYRKNTNQIMKVIPDALAKVILGLILNWKFLSRNL